MHEVISGKVVLLIAVFAVFAVLGFFVFYSSSILYAETAPVFIVTWDTNTYAAPSYNGKRLPTSGSLVNVTFELVQNGNIIQLNSQEVRWFLNSSLIVKGRGLKELEFTPRSSSGAYFVRIELPKFRGEYALSKSIQIPVTSPKVAVDAPYNKNSLGAREFNLRALPYYFNVSRNSDLLFRWEVNGKSPSGDVSAPDTLSVIVPASAPQRSKISIKAEALNTKNKNERAETMEFFTTK